MKIGIILGTYLELHRKKFTPHTYIYNLWKHDSPRYKSFKLYRSMIHLYTKVQSLSKYRLGNKLGNAWIWMEIFYFIMLLLAFVVENSENFEYNAVIWNHFYTLHEDDHGFYWKKKEKNLVMGKNLLLPMGLSKNSFLNFTFLLFSIFFIIFIQMYC